MGFPLNFIVIGLSTLSLASTLTDAPNFTGTPTLHGESPIVPGVDVPLGLVTTAPRLKHGFAIEQGAVDGPPLTIHVQNNVSDPAFPNPPSKKFGGNPKTSSTTPTQVEVQRKQC